MRVCEKGALCESSNKDFDLCLAVADILADDSCRFGVAGYIDFLNI